MAMKISNAQFPERLEENLQNEFMRNAVSSAQHRFQTRRATATELPARRRQSFREAQW